MQMNEHLTINQSRPLDITFLPPNNLTDPAHNCRGRTDLSSDSPLLEARSTPSNLHDQSSIKLAGIEKLIAGADQDVKHTTIASISNEPTHVQPSSPHKPIHEVRHQRVNGSRTSPAFSSTYFLLGSTSNTFLQMAGNKLKSLGGGGVDVKLVEKVNAAQSV